MEQSEQQEAAIFEGHRRHLTGLAYRMLGSLAAAQDAVQEAYLRWHQADRARFGNARAYLSRIVARLCLDQLKSGSARHEHYVGPWLPEPVLDHAALAAEEPGDYVHDLSMALMLTLERLSPLERAAFLLHDVFDMDFDEVAEALAAAKSHAANSRCGGEPTCAPHGRASVHRSRNANVWRPRLAPPRKAVTLAPWPDCWPRT
jgi:RNA polymerase sigma-70 factor (ECF subfamily)